MLLLLVVEFVVVVVAPTTSEERPRRVICKPVAIHPTKSPVIRTSSAASCRHTNSTNREEVSPDVIPRESTDSGTLLVVVVEDDMVFDKRRHNKKKALKKKKRNLSGWREKRISRLQLIATQHVAKQEEKTKIPQTTSRKELA